MAGLLWRATARLELHAPEAAVEGVRDVDVPLRVFQSGRLLERRFGGRAPIAGETAGPIPREGGDDARGHVDDADAVVVLVGNVQFAVVQQQVARVVQLRRGRGA